MSAGSPSRDGVQAFLYPGPKADPRERRQRAQGRLTFWTLVALVCGGAVLAGSLDLVPLGAVREQGIAWLALIVLAVTASVVAISLAYGLRQPMPDASVPAAPAGWAGFRAARSADVLAMILRGLDLAAVPPDQRWPLPVDPALSLPDGLSAQQLAARLGERLSGCVVFTGQSAFDMGRLRFVTGVDDAAQEPGAGPLLAYSPVVVTVLQATRSQLVVFTGTVDLVTGQQTREHLSRLLWADLVEVGATTRTTARSVAQGPGLPPLATLQHATDLILTKTDQTTLTLPLTRPTLSLPVTPGAVPPLSRHDRLVQQLTAGLLERKDEALAAAARAAAPQASKTDDSKRGVDGETVVDSEPEAPPTLSIAKMGSAGPALP